MSVLTDPGLSRVNISFLVLPKRLTIYYSLSAIRLSMMRTKIPAEFNFKTGIPDFGRKNNIFVLRNLGR